MALIFNLSFCKEDISTSFHTQKHLKVQKLWAESDERFQAVVYLGRYLLLFCQNMLRISICLSKTPVTMFLKKIAVSNWLLPFSPTRQPFVLQRPLNIRPQLQDLLLSPPVVKPASTTCLLSARLLDALLPFPLVFAAMQILASVFVTG
jgi:hypothetical protein